MKYWRHYRGIWWATERPRRNNPIVSCMCGCGRKLKTFDHDGRSHRYVKGHNASGRKANG